MLAIQIGIIFLGVGAFLTSVIYAIVIIDAIYDNDNEFPEPPVADPEDDWIPF